MEKKTVKIGTILSRKSLKDPSWLAHVQCLLQKRTSHRAAGVFNAIQHKGDILLIRTCCDF